MLEMLTPSMLITIGIIVFFLIIIICAFSWYTVVDPSEAHLVVTPRTKFVVSSDEKVGTTKTYFAIPRSIPFFGRVTRKMDVTIKEILIDQETIEEGQARYRVSTSTKYRIRDIKIAAETFINDKELQGQITEIIKSGVRAITVKYNVVDARAKKQEMEQGIRAEITDDLLQWGLELINFQLVDFFDTKESTIITDISRRREVEIEVTTREQNAEKYKNAKIKEAEADELSQKREIERDRVVAEQQQLKNQKIAEATKISQEKEFEVVRVKTIKQAEIDKDQTIIKAQQSKEQAIIKAEQDKETEAILKERKKLEGEGNRLKAEEDAKALAAPIKEKGSAEADVIRLIGFAEADAKFKLQEALNKFGNAAIQALVAEKVVDKDKEIGIALAKALEKAQVRVFAGGGNTAGFDLGSLIESLTMANSDAGIALKNRLARPNDVGFQTLGLAVSKDIADEIEKPEAEKVETKTEKVETKKNTKTFTKQELIELINTRGMKGLADALA